MPQVTQQAAARRLAAAARSLLEIFLGVFAKLRMFFLQNFSWRFVFLSVWDGLGVFSGSARRIFCASLEVLELVCIHYDPRSLGLKEYIVVDGDYSKYWVDPRT